MSQELIWVRDHQSKYIPLRKEYSDYYGGNHKSMFNSLEMRSKLGELFRQVFSVYRSNLCPTVVDTFTDRLQLDGFTTTNTTATTLVADIWKSNRMDVKAGVLHQQALTVGDSYMSVWPDAMGRPHIYTEDADNIAVLYDEYNEQMIQAVKILRMGHHLLITRYLPDRIERYVTKDKALDIPENLTDLIPYDPDGAGSVLANPYSRVPVFHFSNYPGKFAQSELKEVIPIQDALNWSIVYMLIGAEYLALPQRVIIGVEPKYDENGMPIPINGGAGKVWQLGNENAKVDQFDPADLSTFISMQDAFRQDIARVSRTPLHAFNVQNGDWPSGRALRVAEAPLLGKVRDRQILFGDVWEDALTFACQIAGIEVDDLEANWIDTTPDNALEESTIALNMLATGVPKEHIWKTMFHMTDSQIEDAQSQGQQELVGAIDDMLNQTTQAPLPSSVAQ